MNWVDGLTFLDLTNHDLIKVTQISIMDKIGMCIGKTKQ